VLVFGLSQTNQVQAQPAVQNPPQGIAGVWQGTLHGGRDLRQVFKVFEGDSGSYKGIIYSIDQANYGLPITSITLVGADVRISVTTIGGTFEGRVSSDGNTILGHWNQGSAQALTLTRATPETAWALPEPPPAVPPMAANADPSFEVATIKPNNSGVHSLQALTFAGRNLSARNASLIDLIAYGYDMQANQIVGGPEWMDKDRYDIAAVPEEEGMPSDRQLKTMIRKLLAERFALTFHHDKRELSAYVLTVGSTGPRLKGSQSRESEADINWLQRPDGLTLNFVNATMPDFTGYLQMLVLDRPVVDQTGIPGRFDFQCTFMPNDSEFGGHPPPLPPQTNTTNSSPGLFDAIKDQLGLKLDAKKTPVDLMVIDHIEKPSGN
jgi:uncharacterized protein (TIGR03435 family)